MGLKAGLQILQKVVANYADDAARIVATSGDDAARAINKGITLSSTTKAVSHGLERTNKAFLQKIDDIHISGVKPEEESILKMIKDSLYDFLGKTKGKGALPTEIKFERCRRDGIKIFGVANVDSTNVLRINRDYLDNIDKCITTNLDDFIQKGHITRNEKGVYKIADHLRNSKSEIFERRLNEYVQGGKNWPLDYKFKFHRTSMNYYANLTWQSTNHPSIMLENIFKEPSNVQHLKSWGFFRNSEELAKMPIEEQRKLLKDIFTKYSSVGKSVKLPETTAGITSVNQVCYHELGHVNHNARLMELNKVSEARKLKTPEKLQEWRSNPQIQKICGRVSGYSSTSPSEFVAEVYASLLNGQTLHPDVMALYSALKGPMI